MKKLLLPLLLVGLLASFAQAQDPAPPPPAGLLIAEGEGSAQSTSNPLVDYNILEIVLQSTVNIQISTKVQQLQNQGYIVLFETYGPIVWEIDTPTHRKVTRKWYLFGFPPPQ